MPLVSEGGKKRPPYKTVHVLFLSWECLPDGPTAKHIQSLKELLGKTYNFQVHEFSIPAVPDRSQSDLLRYLMRSGLLSGSIKKKSPELLIVVYNGLGSGSPEEGGYHINGYVVVCHSPL